MNHLHATAFCCISALLNGCTPRVAPATTPERPEAHASHYSSDFVLPEGVEVALDCPNRFCVELTPSPASRLDVPADAAEAQAVLTRYMEANLLPTFRDRATFAAADHVVGCHGGRGLTVHTSDFNHLAAFVNEAGEMLSHYRSPLIQVCAGTTNELN